VSELHTILRALGTLDQSCERPGIPGGALQEERGARRGSTLSERLGSLLRLPPSHHERHRAPSLRSTRRAVPLPISRAAAGSHGPHGFLSCRLSARPRSAQVPGLSSAVFLAVLVQPSTAVPSKPALALARSPRRGSPVGSTHAQRPFSTRSVSRSPVWAQPYNLRLQRTVTRLLIGAAAPASARQQLNR
jgi:hypothetical protein